MPVSANDDIFFFFSPWRICITVWSIKWKKKKNVPKSYTLVQKKGKPFVKEEKTKSSCERCDQDRLGSRLCLYLCVGSCWKPRAGFRCSRALKILFIKWESGGQTCRRWSLGSEPWVREAEGCCGPSLRDQVQHRQQKTAKVVSFFFWPLVLFYQNIKQTPRLQFGDVTQIPWKQNVSL